MKFSDIVSAAGQTTVAQISLVLAFAAFSVVVVWAVLRPKREIDHCSRIPLGDVPTEPHATNGGPR